SEPATSCTEPSMQMPSVFVGALVHVTRKPGELMNACAFDPMPRSAKQPPVPVPYAEMPVAGVALFCINVTVELALFAVAMSIAVEIADRELLGVGAARRHGVREVAARAVAREHADLIDAVLGHDDVGEAVAGHVGDGDAERQRPRRDRRRRAGHEAAEPVAR